MSGPVARALLLPGGRDERVRFVLPGNRWDLLDGLEPPVAPKVSIIILRYGFWS